LQFTLAIKGRAIIRSDTAISRFIKSSNRDSAALPLASDPPGLYSFAISVGLVTYQRERLTRIAELAYSQRNVTVIERAGRELLPFDSNAALYYLAIAAKWQGRTDEARKLLESVRGNYQARAIHALGAIHHAAGQVDEAALFYSEAIKAKRGHDLFAFVGSQFQASAIKSVRGQHEQSLDDLLLLYDVVRIAAKRHPHLWPTLYNEIACELLELGRVEEAKRAASIATSSPLAYAYPEIQETAQEIAEKQRQTVLVVVPSRKQKVITRFLFVCTALELPGSHVFTVAATAATNCYITAQHTLELLGKCIKARAPPLHS
jgi:tetratricopeptide (TPR) repeat protein